VASSNLRYKKYGRFFGVVSLLNCPIYDEKKEDWVDLVGEITFTGAKSREEINKCRQRYEEVSHYDSRDLKYAFIFERSVKFWLQKPIKIPENLQEKVEKFKEYKELCRTHSRWHWCISQKDHPMRFQNKPYNPITNITHEQFERLLHLRQWLLRNVVRTKSFDDDFMQVVEGMKEVKAEILKDLENMS